MSALSAGQGQPTVAYVSLGCRVNRVETDAIVSELLKRGLALADEHEADAVVINSCAVTGEAEAKARKAVRHAARLRQEPVVVVTGCLAALNARALEQLGSRVVVEPAKARVAERVISELGVSPEVMAAVPRCPGAREHGTATGRTRAGVKIQDGCDLRCSYCIVWKARGPSRSVAPEEVVEQVRAASDQGAPEVMLTGINLGCYRARDSRGSLLGLSELLELLLERTDVGRLRLGSLEPQDVDETLADVVARSAGRIAPFFHLCLQTGSDEILSRMGRVYSSKLYAERVQILRAAVPDVALGTDLIVGFPGEGEREFAESLAFCERMGFSRMHVFRFSPRPGTPAASLTDPVDPRVAARRSGEARALAARMRLEAARQLCGHDDLVCVQEPGVGVSSGLFDARVPSELAPGTLAELRVAQVLPDATLVCAGI